MDAWINGRMETGRGRDAEAGAGARSAAILAALRRLKACATVTNRLCLSVFLYGLVMPASSQSSTLPITGEKQRLLILPSAATGELQPVADEVVSIVSDVATSLGRFEVVDRNDLDEILREQALQLTGIIEDSLVAEVGQIASAHEALIIDVVNFHQEGVPPEDDKKEDADDSHHMFGRIVLEVVKGIFEAGRQNDEEERRDPYAHNIQTTLSVRVKKVEVESGRTLNSFTATASHTGGTRGYSRGRVMENFRSQALAHIKEFYTLTSEVISVSGGEVLLFLGSSVGVDPGTLFEIVQPDQVTAFRGRDITVPGKRVGVVQVRGSSPESNRSIILRNWSPVHPGYKAVEYTRTPLAVELRYLYTFETPFGGLQVDAVFRPFHFTSFGGEVRVGNVTDSYGDSDFILGLGGYAARKILKTSRISLVGQLTLNTDFAIRPDDADHTVTAALFSVAPQVGLEFLLSEARDLTLAAGYRLGAKSSRWTYSYQTGDGTPERADGVWTSTAPEVNISGLFFVAGIKFTIF